MASIADKLGKLTPKGSRILVVTDFASGKSGKLILPKNTKVTQEMTKGVVISIGSEVCETKIGETILFGMYAGMILERNEFKFTLMNEGDILAVDGDVPIVDITKEGI